jgi:hypothetical protein
LPLRSNDLGKLARVSPDQRVSCPFDQKTTRSRDAVHELIKVISGNCGIVGSANDECGYANFPEPRLCRKCRSARGIPSETVAVPAWLILR